MDSLYEQMQQPRVVPATQAAWAQAYGAARQRSVSVGHSAGISASLRQVECFLQPSPHPGGKDVSPMCLKGASNVSQRNGRIHYSHIHRAQKPPAFLHFVQHFHDCSHHDNNNVRGAFARHGGRGSRGQPPGHSTSGTYSACSARDTSAGSKRRAPHPTGCTDGQRGAGSLRRREREHNGGHTTSEHHAHNPHTKPHADPCAHPVAHTSPGPQPITCAVSIAQPGPCPQPLHLQDRCHRPGGRALFATSAVQCVPRRNRRRAQRGVRGLDQLTVCRPHGDQGVGLAHPAWLRHRL